MLDFLRIGCAVPAVRLGDPMENARRTAEYMEKAEAAGCDLLVFPELSLTGYTCADLFQQESLLAGAGEALKNVTEKSRSYPDLTVCLGLPLLLQGQLYNVAAVLENGSVLGIVPKVMLPTYGEFYERRWFRPGTELPVTELAPSELGLSGENIPVGTDLLFRVRGTTLGLEICEDLWAPVPPSSLLALRGAEVVVNLSASNETIGKRAYRRNLVRHQSAACTCVYAYCSAGAHESTQDLIFSGHCLIGENGGLLGETDTIGDDFLLVRDCDLGRIRFDRRKNTTFQQNAALHAAPMRFISGSRRARSDGGLYPVAKLPFVPSAQQDRHSRCMEIFGMQVAGLCRRLELLNCKAVIGVSGGLDSTLALLVAVEAMHRLGRPASEVCAVTMPCFGTTDRTYRNSMDLMEALGVSIREVNIRQAVDIHFRDIGHDPTVLDTTYENCQARERTQILMDYAGQVGGIVIGTGDLSELALGWCTYNGDHMSMYGVNGSIPKTLIRWMIQSISEMPAFAPAKAVLEDILDTPISPELLPPDADGKIAQQTEDLVGPYALHVVFLYYALRFGFRPEKIYTLACRAFREDFDGETVKKWLKTFYRRFFSQQFKRSCLPDGVKVGSVCLSPRGDWRMPSDASARLWLDEAEKL